MIELRNISKSFGANVILNDVSIAVVPGEFMTFLGPSGSGKTTALRIISGFEQPDDGSVFLGERDITAEPAFKRDINQIFQSYALFPHLTVVENIAFGLKVRRLPETEMRRKVQKAIESVSLSGTEKRYPAQLSGGERQRVAIARAMVCEPKVLLLDEPLSALDAKLQEQMKIELKALQQRLGITFIYVTHDQDHALSLSDRIAVMNHGRIEQIGTPTEIYHHPQTRFVASFVGDTNLLDAEVVGQNGHVTFRLEGGLLLDADIQGDVPSGAAKLSLRPEKVRLRRQKSDGLNSFRCRVESSVFRGALQIVHVRTAGGLRLQTLQAIETITQPAFESGEDVFCSVASADITLLTQN